jgi:hypothetical protein
VVRVEGNWENVNESFRLGCVGVCVGACGRVGEVGSSFAVDNTSAGAHSRAGGILKSTAENIHRETLLESPNFESHMYITQKKNRRYLLMSLQKGATHRRTEKSCFACVRASQAATHLLGSHPHHTPHTHHVVEDVHSTNGLAVGYHDRVHQNDNSTGEWRQATGSLLDRGGEKR